MGNAGMRQGPSPAWGPESSAWRAPSVLPRTQHHPPFKKKPTSQAGWGKRLTYVMAASPQGVADVSRKYAKDWSATLRRRQMVDEGGVRGVGAPMPAAGAKGSACWQAGSS